MVENNESTLAYPIGGFPTFFPHGYYWVSRFDDFVIATGTFYVLTHGDARHQLSKCNKQQHFEDLI
jgi:hypothetical protein